MKRNRMWKWKLATLALVSVAALSAACGSSSSPLAPLGTSTGGLTTGGPGIPGNFTQYCAQIGGSVVQYLSTQTLCYVRKDFSSEYVGSIGSSFPILTPQDPASALANPKLLPVLVHAGDRLIFHADSTSGFDVQDCGSFCIYDSLNKYKLDGSNFSASGGAAYNGGVRTGLVANVGEGVPFLLGYSYDKILTEEGALRYGYNIPNIDSYNRVGHSVWVNKFELRHCEDMSARTVECPFPH